MTDRTRRQRLLNLLSTHRELAFADIVARLHASKATVRRDLTWLAERNLLSRRRGMAIHKPRHPAGAGAPEPHRVGNLGHKQAAIARHAAALCGAGDAVILSGPGTSAMVRYLPDTDIRILTNSMETARNVIACSKHEVELTSGMFDRELQVILSEFDGDTPMYWDASLMFIQAAGMAPGGLGGPTQLFVQAERRLMDLADELVVLAASNCFERTAKVLLCPWSAVRRIITDWDAPPHLVSQLRDAGVIVDVIAGPEPDAAGPHCEASHPAGDQGLDCARRQAPASEERPQA